MDADPGVDDFAAMLLALASSERSVLGVSTVAGTVPVEVASSHAGRALALAGREDVPVCAGGKLQPALFEMSPAIVDVETSGHTMGRTYADFLGEGAERSPVEVARRVDAEALLSLLLDQLETYAVRDAATSEMPA